MKSRISEFAGIESDGSGRRFQSWIVDLTGVYGSIVGLGLAAGELRFGVGVGVEIGSGVGVGAGDGMGGKAGSGIPVGGGFGFAATAPPGENTTLKAAPEGTGVPLRLAMNHFEAAASYSTL
jgi:hypothetical protein